MYSHASFTAFETITIISAIQARESEREKFAFVWRLTKERTFSQKCFLQHNNTHSPEVAADENKKEKRRKKYEFNSQACVALTSAHSKYFLHSLKEPHSKI
jgi:hypothetical protein